jgi:hypothetical protein
MALRRLAPARQAPEQQRAWQRLDGPGSVPYSTIAKRPYGLRATCRDTTGHSASFLLCHETPARRRVPPQLPNPVEYVAPAKPRRCGTPRAIPIPILV